MGDGGSQPDEKRLQLLSREELESRVRQRTSDLEQVMDAMADLLVKVDDEGRISMINDAVTEILGYEKSAVEGKPVDVLLADQAESQSSVPSSETLLQQLLGDGTVTDVEIYCATADGETVPMSLSASTIEDEDGRPRSVVWVAKDISERKEAEERAAFLHSILRHDLGNSLQISKGFLEVLSEREFDEDEQRYVEDALAAIDDAAELIADVRTLQRIDGPVQLKSVELENAVTGALERHEQLQREQGVETDLEVDDVTVQADELLGEIFANLVENSLVHSGSDRLRLSTTLDDETVTVHVEDDGIGIPPDEQEQIFKRGFSAGESSGSGLGMYIVRRLVDAYDGSVSLSRSELGGAQFDVELNRVNTE